ncbi:spore coat protein [Sporomusa acidovorans]|uniref:Coat F domain protein n=1 Tax=Sporomusa acidovorans (strain ATCC 49682 / DSM 3132 / Mol) TaxID=1123286 RepID=A0ABZ3J6T6_SPOA4|nr:spore coat protein [Sporomusa acidovorans]OZC19386.1 coat F domain protein [Sporomusa acidovorans DSM 3132]SDD78491.1 Spore coat protein CotF [Sporomusa acidovorans]
MALQLSQKEKQLLQDQQSHERVCIEKYQSYAQQATDSQLKQLFQSYAQQEQQHLSTINSILSGQVPSMNQGQQQRQQMQQSQQTGSIQATAGTSSTANQKDTTLCNDMLMTEKYVSGAYDTAIFEFADANVRQALNHIQKEEQQHGEGIYNYLNSKGAYNG